MTRVLAWWIWQVRFWNIASGKEVRHVAGPEYRFAVAFQKRTRLQTNHHLLKATGDTLRISELSLHGGGADTSVAPEGVAPVGSFRAPQGIESMDCRGTTICVGCCGGAVCILQAPFLAI